jgi:hypothetical protein
MSLYSQGRLVAKYIRPTGSNLKYLPIFDSNLESIIVDSQSEIATAINKISFSFSLKIEGKTEGTSMLCPSLYVENIIGLIFILHVIFIKFSTSNGLWNFFAACIYPTDIVMYTCIQLKCLLILGKIV